MNYDGFMLSAADNMRHRTRWSAQTMFIHVASQAVFIVVWVVFFLTLCSFTYGFQACHAASPCWHLLEFN